MHALLALSRVPLGRIVVLADGAHAEPIWLESLLLALACVGLVALTVLTWRGNIRWRGFFWAVPAMVYMPVGLGLMLATAGATLLATGGETPGEDVQRVVGPLVAVGCGMVGVGFLGILGLVPRFALPGWYRQERAERRARPHRHEPEPTGSTETSRMLDALEALGPAVKTWSANWVHNPHATDHDHALAGAGSIGGTLRLATGGVGFWPNAIEGVARSRDVGPYGVARPGESLTAVWTVPAGADSQGQVVDVSFGARLRRSPHRRLVVGATDVHLVFDLRNAGEVADQLAAYFGVTRAADL